MRKSLVQQHLQLLQGTFFTTIKNKNSFLIVESFLTDSFWNLIIPKVSAEKISFDFLEEFIKKGKSERDFSFYISKELNPSYTKILESKEWENSFVDVYVYKELNKKLPVNLKDNEEFGQVNSKTYPEYIKQVEFAFPEYENQIEYTKRFYNFGNRKEDKELRNFVIKNKKEIICFQSIIYSKKLNLAYLHNGGTNEKYRRQGYFIKLNKLMCNYLFDNGITRIYGLVEESSASHKAFKKLKFITNSKYYLYNNL